jgi:hypothetical protein
MIDAGNLLQLRPERTDLALALTEAARLAKDQVLAGMGMGMGANSYDSNSGSGMKIEGELG